MVDVRTVAVSVVAVLSVFLQHGIKAQPTIDFSSETLDSCSYLEEECAVENIRLRSELESERRTIESIESMVIEPRRKRSRELQSVRATFLNSLDHLQPHYGITKVEDKLYVMGNGPDEIRKIKVYDDGIDFRFITDTSLNNTGWPHDIVYTHKSKRVYISDYAETCIWMMTTTGEPRLAKWLPNVHQPFTLSLSNEGHLLVLRQGQSPSPDCLEIYSLNATLIRKLDLTQDVKYAQHVVQTSTGNFIISHRLNNVTDGQWTISEFTNDGQLSNRVIARNKSEELSSPKHLSLDSDNNRLYVADTDNHRVILFDSNDLTWIKVLLSREMNGILNPFRLLYDSCKKRLFVAEHHSNVTAHEISWIPALQP